MKKVIFREKHKFEDAIKEIYATFGDKVTGIKATEYELELTTLDSFNEVDIATLSTVMKKHTTKGKGITVKV